MNLIVSNRNRVEKKRKQNETLGNEIKLKENEMKPKEIKGNLK